MFFYFAEKMKNQPKFMENCQKIKKSWKYVVIIFIKVVKVNRNEKMK